jgi:HK97 family phage portal protein
MSLIRRALSVSLEQRGAPGQLEWGSSVPPSNGMIGGAVAGTTVSEKTALQVAAVYGSVSVLADAVSTLPIHVVNDPESPTRKRLPPPQLIKEPYVEISLTDWWTQFTISMALRGNFYGQIIERDSELYATQIKPIHPDQARAVRRQNGEIEYRFFGKVIPNRDVFHVRYLSVPGALHGLNPVEYLRNSLGLARAQDLYGAAWFQNSAMPSGVIEVEGDLDPDETLALARTWMAGHQGIGQSSLPAILTGGSKFATISMNPEDSQFIESRGFSQSEISGQLFRVPPHMIGVVDKSTSWGRGIEQQETGFVRNTLSAYITRGERALTALLRPKEYVEFDIDSRMQGDTLERGQYYSLGMLGGWLTADEVRAKESMPPLPKNVGKISLAPINTEPIEAMLERIKREKKEAENGEKQQAEQISDQETEESKEKPKKKSKEGRRLL